MSFWFSRNPCYLSSLKIWHILHLCNMTVMTNGIWHTQNMSIWVSKESEGQHLKSSEFFLNWHYSTQKYITEYSNTYICTERIHQHFSWFLSRGKTLNSWVCYKYVFQNIWLFSILAGPPTLIHLVLVYCQADLEKHINLQTMFV